MLVALLLVKLILLLVIIILLVVKPLVTLSLVKLVTCALGAPISALCALVHLHQGARHLVPQSGTCTYVQ